MDTMMALNHMPPQYTPREPVASPFYAHPYGGIARDISVTREGFMRFFELDEFDMAFAESFAGQGQKMYDKLPDDWTEACGYIGLHPGGRMTYRIDFISRHSKRVSELLAIAPYLWHESGQVIDDDVEEGHVWYPTVITSDPIIWGDYSGDPKDY